MSPKAALDTSPAHCLKLRHKDSSCRLCLDNCPQDAINIGQSLAVDNSLCNGCGICASVCPTGVFQLPDIPYSRLVSRVKAGKSTIEFACSLASPTKDTITVPCLGYLDDAILVAAIGSNANTVSLNFAACKRCDNRSGLRAAARTLKRANSVLALFGTSKKILAIARGTDNEQTPPSSRREFFSFLKQETWNMVTSAMNSADDDRKTRVTLDSKLPDKRARLLQNINSLGAPVTDGVKTSNLPFAQLAIDNRRCDGCRICTTFCPTGALSCFDQEGRQIIAFRIDYCLDCKLCSDICPRDAITFSGNISPNSILSTHWRSLVAHPTSACIKCGQTYITMAGTNLCLSCRKRKEQEEWIVNRLQPRQEK